MMRRAFLAIFLLLVLIILCILIFGCSTMNPPVRDGTLRTFSVTYQDDLEQKFQEVIDYCLPRLQNYEQKAMGQSSKAFWMNMSGLVAGAVFAPMIIASGSTGPLALAIVTGLSGWAGATPFASDALRVSGLSGVAVAQMRNQIVDRIRDKSIIALDGSRTTDERRNAIMGIVGECTIYPMLVPGEE